MILTQAQAEAVYTAMCALNNYVTKIKIMFGDVSTVGINIFEDFDGHVHVVYIQRYEITKMKLYIDQAAFAAAYNLG